MHSHEIEKQKGRKSQDECPGTPVSRFFEIIPEGHRTNYLLQTITTKLAPTLANKQIQCVQYPSWWGDGHQSDIILDQDKILLTETTATQTSTFDSTHHERINSLMNDVIEPIINLIPSLKISHGRPINKSPTSSTLADSNTYALATNQTLKSKRNFEEKRKILQKSHNQSLDPTSIKSPSTRTKVRSSMTRAYLSPSLDNYSPKAIKASKDCQYMRDSAINGHDRREILDTVKVLDIVRLFLESDFMGCLDLSLLDDDTS